LMFLSLLRALTPNPFALTPVAFAALSQLSPLPEGEGLGVRA
jgi:hypothetical protein